MIRSAAFSEGTGRPVTAAIIESAAGHAAAAASAAGVRIEAAWDPPRLHAVAELLGQVWGTAPGQSPLTPDVLRAIAHAGGVVHVAGAATGPPEVATGPSGTATGLSGAATGLSGAATGLSGAATGPSGVSTGLSGAATGPSGVSTGLSGATAAIFGPPASRSAYSLIAAARSSDRGVGFALKQAQRAWALGHGITSIIWTFDPLVSRNARFNLVKLGAVACQYTVDFYGSLDDEINKHDETDRLTVRWVLAGERATRAAQGHPSPAGGPDTRAGALRAPDGGALAVRAATGVLWCRVPEDIVALRRRDPDQAARWRLAVRGVLGRAFAEGLVATAMTRDGWYRLESG